MTMNNAGWLDGFSIIEGEGSGSWGGNVDAAKGVAHTTEGDSLAGAVSAFRSARSWPHITTDPVRRLKAQHVSLLGAARALRNTSAPGQTNRDGRTYQVEIVGHAGSIGALPPDALDWLGREVIGPLSRAVGIPLVSLDFHQYPPENGIRLDGHEPWRMSAADFDAYAGWLGHQHVPENLHGDPGRINFARVLRAAGATTPPNQGEPPMTPAELNTIVATIERTLPFAVRLTKNHGTYERGQVVVINPADGTCWTPGRATLNSLYFVGAIRHDDNNEPPAGNPDDFPAILDNTKEQA